MPSNAPVAAKPTKVLFDPFNSSATGHQRAENRLSGSTSWRDSRHLKLRQQFRAGAGGGSRVSDSVGAGSLDFGLDGRTENGGFERGAKGLRKDGQNSLWESMRVEKDIDDRHAKRQKIGEAAKPSNIVNPFTPFRRADGTVRQTSWTSHEYSPSDLLEPIEDSFPTSPTPHGGEIESDRNRSTTPTAEDESAPQIFANLCFYINGSTAPYSDHNVKYLLSRHGGSVSIALGRKSVTHVVIGRPNSNGGCGGGLAGSKIQKEVARVGGKAVKFVTADWVVDSVKAAKRLPESRYEAMKIAPKGVASISSIFSGQRTK